MFNNTILGIIYLIKHKTCDDKKVYVGSTNDLKQRIIKHRHSCKNEKNKKYNNKLYQYIRENGGFYMYEILILECYVCNLKHELHYREDNYIKMYDNNLNQLRAYLTDEEYKKRHKKYYDENKDKVLERYKKYYDENKDKVLERIKKYYDENKDKVLERSKKYREVNNDKIKEKYNKNKDIISQKKKEKITCECGSIVRKNDIARHCKSLKHIAFIEKK